MKYQNLLTKVAVGLLAAVTLTSATQTQARNRRELWDYTYNRALSVRPPDVIVGTLSPFELDLAAKPFDAVTIDAEVARLRGLTQGRKLMLTVASNRRNGIKDDKYPVWATFQHWDDDAAWSWLDDNFRYMARACAKHDIDALLFNCEAENAGGTGRPGFDEIWCSVYPQAIKKPYDDPRLLDLAEQRGREFVRAVHTEAPKLRIGHHVIWRMQSTNTLQRWCKGFYDEAARLKQPTLLISFDSLGGGGEKIRKNLHTRFGCPVWPAYEFRPEDILAPVKVQERLLTARQPIMLFPQDPQHPEIDLEDVPIWSRVDSSGFSTSVGKSR